MQNAPYQEVSYAPSAGYFYVPLKVLRMLVVPMDSGSAPYAIDLPIKGTAQGRVYAGGETSLKEVFGANVGLAKSIFGPYAPQDPPCFRQAHGVIAT